MTRFMTGALVFMLANWAACAAAQDTAAPPSGDAPPELSSPLPAKPDADTARQRFRFTKTSDGVLRLDSQTGQVSYCNPRTIGWGCQAVPEDRAALDTEIARLQAQVAALTKEVAGLRTNGSAATPRPPEAVPPSREGELKLPRREDLDRAKERTMAFIEDTWRRLVEMLEQLRKDMRRT